jgi:hypothetical protein
MGYAVARKCWQLSADNNCVNKINWCDYLRGDIGNPRVPHYNQEHITAGIINSDRIVEGVVAPSIAVKQTRNYTKPTKF